MRPTKYLQSSPRGAGPALNFPQIRHERAECADLLVEGRQKHRPLSANLCAKNCFAGSRKDLSKFFRIFPTGQYCCDKNGSGTVFISATARRTRRLASLVGNRLFPSTQRE
ncbi:unnamed protein product [Ixodes pacificus]